MKIVGDKFPNYVYQLDSILKIDNLKCLVIYRDPRDVVSSTFKMVSQISQSWTNSYSSAEKIAHRWNKAIGAMEKNIENLYCIKYEHLITQTRNVIAELSAYLDVDPAEFSLDFIHDKSIGKYKNSLTQEDLTAVINIAGPTMARLGYV